MRIHRNGWLTGISRCSSPNHNQRPAGEAISLLVIHGISLPPDHFAGPAVQQLFCNQLDANAHPYFAEIKELRVSAHLFIRRAGSMIQFVSFDDRAWHAGVSEFAGRDNCNDFSIGIEMEGNDSRPYTQAQYRQLLAVTRLLSQRYPRITQERVVGHCDIAPGRKTDPGPYFDWATYKAALTA
ncbi:MAG: 1,6-anhydro-N-acetylmuramyl-L-alanine amidase AmpD [Oceanococcus sp.]